MRLGIFGGTFDPVHYGHLLLADAAREQAGLDQVWFVPAAIPPHKQDRQIAAAEARCEMLELAVAGYEPFHVYRGEIERGGVSYTVDTLAAIQAEDSSRSLFLLIGADSLDDLPQWRDPARICQLALPLVVARPGCRPVNPDVLAPWVAAERRAEIADRVVRMPLVDFSSSDLRQRVSTGRSIRFRTPRAVEQYIAARGLYAASVHTAESAWPRASRRPDGC